MAQRNVPYGGRGSVPMDPGERDKRITLEQRSAPAGGGYPRAAWSTLDAAVWARKIDTRMSERQAADGEAARVDCRWEINYRADMDPELIDVAALRRLVYQGRIYEIIGASVIGGRLGVELLTIARSAGPSA